MKALILNQIIRIGTRGSPLALAQAHQVRSLLEGYHVEIVIIHTTGDLILDRSLAEAGGKGLFTREIDEAMLDGRIDIAVHSMKDVPTLLPDGIALPCILEREDPRDGFISLLSNSIESLPQGSVVGTASLRRKAQILLRRPDLEVIPLRGNVQTRLRKLADGDVIATFLAMAGLHRLKLKPQGLVPVPVTEMLPAVAQAAIGVTCRLDDASTMACLSAIDHPDSHVRVYAERSFLRVLDGSCRTPIAGHAVLTGDHLELQGQVLRPDGSEAQIDSISGHRSDAEKIGQELGNRLLARIGSGYFAKGG